MGLLVTSNLQQNNTVKTLDQQQRTGETWSLWSADNKNRCLQDWRRCGIDHEKTSGTRRLVFFAQSFKGAANSSLSRLLLRNKMTSADVIFRCATLIYLSSSRDFWGASLSSFRRKEFAETKICRDWFQENHYWQCWEEQIITTLTSFDHRYTYSQNVSVDRTMRWRAWNSDRFAPDFSPLHAQTPNRSSVWHDK